MDLLELERKLIAAARSNPPVDHVPYAFEKRVMSLVQTQSRWTPDALWARALWRGAGVCVLAVVLVVGTLSHFIPRTGGSPTDLSQDFEKTMLAAVDQDADYSW